MRCEKGGVDPDRLHCNVCVGLLWQEVVHWRYVWRRVYILKGYFTSIWSYTTGPYKTDSVSGFPCTSTRVHQTVLDESTILQYYSSMPRCSTVECHTRQDYVKCLLCCATSNAFVIYSCCLLLLKTLLTDYSPLTTAYCHCCCCCYWLLSPAFVSATCGPSINLHSTVLKLVVKPSSSSRVTCSVTRPHDANNWIFFCFFLFNFPPFFFPTDSPPPPGFPTLSFPPSGFPTRFPLPPSFFVDSFRHDCIGRFETTANF